VAKNIDPYLLATMRGMLDSKFNEFMLASDLKMVSTFP